MWKSKPKAKPQNGYLQASMFSPKRSPVCFSFYFLCSLVPPRRFFVSHFAFLNFFSNFGKLFLGGFLGIDHIFFGDAMS
jgi:hypothetical protein